MNNPGFRGEQTCYSVFFCLGVMGMGLNMVFKRFMNFGEKFVKIFFVKNFDIFFDFQKNFPTRKFFYSQFYL